MESGKEKLIIGRTMCLESRIQETIQCEDENLRSVQNLKEKTKEYVCTYYIICRGVMDKTVVENCSTR